MRSSLAEIRPLKTSSTVSYTRACCQGTHFQRMSQHFMSSTRNAQLIIVQLSGSRRRRAYPSRFLNTHRARRCGLPVSFGRLVPSTRRYGVIGTELGSLDAFYYECQFCRYAQTTSLEDGERGERKDCEACGGIRYVWSSQTLASAGPGLRIR